MRSPKCTLGPKKRRLCTRALKFVTSAPAPSDCSGRGFARDAKSEMHAGPKEAHNLHAGAKVHYFGPKRLERTEFFREPKVRNARWAPRKRRIGARVLTNRLDGPRALLRECVDSRAAPTTVAIPQLNAMRSNKDTARAQDARHFRKKRIESLDVGQHADASHSVEAGAGKRQSSPRGLPGRARCKPSSSLPSRATLG